MSMIYSSLLTKHIKMEKELNALSKQLEVTKIKFSIKKLPYSDSQGLHGIERSSFTCQLHVSS